MGRGAGPVVWHYVMPYRRLGEGLWLNIMASTGSPPERSEPAEVAPAEPMKRKERRHGGGRPTSPDDGPRRVTWVARGKRGLWDAGRGVSYYRAMLGERSVGRLIEDRLNVGWVGYCWVASGGCRNCWEK